MKKLLVSLTVLTLTVLVLSSSALAFGGFGSGQNENCLRFNLDGELQDQFESIISSFREQMTLVREKMAAARAGGDREALQALREERLQLMDEKRAALSEILPEEMAGHFQQCGRGMRNFGKTGESGNFN